MNLSQGACRGKFFWHRSDDRYIGQRIAVGKYEPYLTDLMLKNISSNDTVVDVGANIGYDTVLFGSRAKKVYAFEPEEISFGILKKNIEENNLKNVELFKLAVGRKKEKKGLVKSKENFGDNRLSNKGDVIEVVRLDDLIKEKVDLIKIDTQGWEPEVIAGAKNIISKYHPKIFFEFNPPKNEEMWNFLMEEYGRIYYIDEYIQIYYPIMKCDMECNMWVGESSRWGQYKDFWPKKWLKRMLGRPAT